MEEAIKNFNTQFEWKPEIVHGAKLAPARRFELCGMGGSALAADLFKIVRPELELSVHRDYGLPPRTSKDTLYIADSFSGNTEEALDFATKVQAGGLPLAVIAKGGALARFATEHTVPHIILPPADIQPRSGLGYQTLALAAWVSDEKLLEELAELSSVLAPETLRGAGQKLANELRSKIPVIYASARNAAVAYNWKIKMNETGKIPAFYNVIPELNHNEMTGFDLTPSTEGLSRRLHFIFLSDTEDHPQNQKRMKVTRGLYTDRGLACTEVALWGHGTLEKIFTSLLIADWTALYLAGIYGTEAEQVPMVEEFKRLIA